MKERSDYYVYVYIDPRNNEEFYYGKGMGSRKSAHLMDRSESEKSRRIAAIKKAGVKPIIRVIARELTESQALLVEKTLLWKLGKSLTNLATGHFTESFRPHNTLHKLIPGFDFRHRLMYVNVGQGSDMHRSWVDSRKYGFLAAGQGIRWRDQICRLNVGDIVAAFVATRGYVGIGRVLKEARMINEVTFNGKPALRCRFDGKGMKKNSGDEECSEFLCLVKWIKTVPVEEAYWKRTAGLFSTQLVTASLSNQQKTLRFLEGAFEVSFEKLLMEQEGSV